jgi:hypothetical protein
MSEINNLLHLVSIQPRIPNTPTSTCSTALKKTVDPACLKWGDESWWKKPAENGSIFRDTSVVKIEIFRLGDLPPELREMIFKYADLEWTTRRPMLTSHERVPRSMPPLIIALRGCQVMYHEALTIFYRQTKFIFEYGSPWNYDRMSLKALATLQKVQYIM